MIQNPFLSQSLRLGLYIKKEKKKSPAVSKLILSIRYIGSHDTASSISTSFKGEKSFTKSNIYFQRQCKETYGLFAPFYTALPPTLRDTYITIEKRHFSLRYFLLKHFCQHLTLYLFIFGGYKNAMDIYSLVENRT